MATKNNTATVSTVSKTFDLAAIKEAARFYAETKELSWNGETLTLTPALLEQVIILGVYRQASADSAKGGYNAEFENKFFTRLRAGYLNDRAYQNSLKAVTETKAGTVKKPAFGQFEIIAMARSMTNDEKTLTSLDVVAGYNDVKFSLLLAKVADNAESIITKAIVELTRIANEKAESERAAIMAELIDL